MADISLENLNTTEIMRSAGFMIAQRGRILYNEGAVTVESVEGDEAIFSVEGSQIDPYEVVIQLNPRPGLRSLILNCDCPYVDRGEYVICKHMVASALALEAYLKENPPNPWKNVLSKPIQYAHKTEARSARLVVVFNVYQEYGRYWTVAPHSLDAKHFKDIEDFDNDTIANIIKKEHLSNSTRQIRSRSIDFANILNGTPEVIAAVSATVLASQYYYDTKQFPSTLPILKDCLVYLGDREGSLKHRLFVASENGRLELDIEQSPEGLEVDSYVVIDSRKLKLDSKNTKLLSLKPLWVLHDDLVFKLDEAPEVVEAFCKHPKLEIPSQDVNEFYESYLAPLAERIPLSGSMMEWEDIHADPIPQLHLSDKDGELSVYLKFGYANHELPYDPKTPQPTLKRLPGEGVKLQRIYRQLDKEEEAWKELSSYGLKRGKSPDVFQLRANVDIVDFLIQQVPRLTRAGFEIHGEDSLTTARVNRSTPTMNLVVSSNMDWFDVQGIVNFGDIEVSLREIRRAIRKQQSYIKLPDGSMGHIPEEWFITYQPLLGLSEDTDEGIRLSKLQAVLLEQAMAEAGSVEADEEFRQTLAKLRSFSSISPCDLPEGFKGELRHYQKSGYDWLHFLHEFNVGGCLADDMGIGKTVQALVFLQSLHESGHAKKADLIVVPRSLLFNWEREAAKFTPKLKLHIHAESDRSDDVSTFDQYDVILTTYGIMLRDIDILQTYRFHYLILDESQQIKNPLALTGKAARALQGDHRLVLTGTPVENNTTELWSQFAFINPGMLGTLDTFRVQFATKIEKRQNEQAAETLRKLVYPFILRRTKSQVAPELPPRTERILYSDMEPAQRKLYERWRDYYRAYLLGMIEKEGFNKTRMKILEGLLRLRQICIHPRLIDPKFKGSSAKMDILMETLETLRAEGHKALVFSQFTSMLKLVKDSLDLLGIPYVYLDGRTQNRQEKVDTFQNNPEIPFFLISLKAGGVGLNLTAADYVIHIDPWWNPAVEAQATDRTHRIGQDKPVFVYKLIANDSVEEKMLQLQNKKRALVSKLISNEAGVIKSLTQEDIEMLFS